jgi:hypothetical protein
VQVTAVWLTHVAAPFDLRREVAGLALHLAQERDELDTLALARLCTVRTLTASGMFDLAQRTLDTSPAPATTAETAGVHSLLLLARSLVAAVDGRSHEADLPLQSATDLAERFGGSTGNDRMGCEYGSQVVQLEAMHVALEVGDHDRAVHVGQAMAPNALPNTTRRAAYWTGYGQGLANIRGRRSEAVGALRRAEELFPERVYRHPIVRNTVLGLVKRTKHDALGRELRGLAHRTGLRA